MLKIMLACCSGMSTSVLVNKMRKHCETNEIEAEIWAISEIDIAKEIDKCDVILLGPQVRHLLSEAKSIADANGKPIDVIDTMAYGLCDGQKVVNHALSLLEKN